MDVDGMDQRLQEMRAVLDEAEKALGRGDRAKLVGCCEALAGRVLRIKRDVAEWHAAEQMASLRRRYPR